jgi:hypothetical protein
MHRVPWFGVALALLAGCRATNHYLVPVGGKGQVPDSVGARCTSDKRAVIEIADTRFTVIGPGSASVHCDRSSLVLDAAEISALRLHGPDDAMQIEAEATATDGRRFNLGLLTEESFKWTSATAKLRATQCGEFGPVCSGGLGGAIRRIEGTGAVDLTVGHATAHLDVRPSASGSLPGR